MISFRVLYNASVVPCRSGNKIKKMDCESSKEAMKIFPYSVVPQNPDSLLGIERTDL